MSGGQPARTMRAGAKANGERAGSLATSAQHPAQLAGRAGPESQPRAKTNPGSSQLSPAAPWQLWGQSPNPNPTPHNHKLICTTTSQHERRWSQKTHTHTHKNSAGKAVTSETLP